MTLDRRINAFRDDLAEKSLEGQVQAARFVEGRPARVKAPVLDLRPVADPASGIDSQCLFGETVRILDEADGWAWIKADIDAYVGYARSDGLGEGSSPATHMVCVPRSFCYDQPDLKKPVRRALSMGSRLIVTGSARTREVDYCLLEDGSAVFAGHCRPLDMLSTQDHVSVAASFLQTPYLWGGRSGFGIDCSGLVQISQMMIGKQAPRDSDMQAAGLGQAIDHHARQRGDLVFWRGHVAIFEDRDHVIHASGYVMQVCREAYTDAVERIKPTYGDPVAIRRP